MKKSTKTTIALLAILAAAIAIYFYYLRDKPLPTEADSVKEIAVPPGLPEPAAPTETRQVLEAPTEPLELPALESSDDFMGSALASLVGNKALMGIFQDGQLIRNIVVTIDNLPRTKVSMRVMPIKKAPGKFMVAEEDGSTTISPQNNARYDSYVKFAEAIDPEKLVGLYVQLYPLFQQSYEAIGYQDQYFNDRLLSVIDHLLATPDVAEPVQLVRPKYFYLYADADLESRSIGQRILMRVGSANAKLVKDKLQAIKQAVALHMHEQKIE